MSPPRLFSNVPLGADSRIVLDAERAHYAGRVLRLRAGDTVAVFDGRGDEYPATIEFVSKRELAISTGRRLDREVESPLHIRLVQGLAKGDRMDSIVQKATELGVSRISPVLCEFSVIRLDPERARKRLGHWRKVTQSACEQCGRNRLPRIDAPQPLPAFFSEFATNGGTGLILKPDAAVTLRGVERQGDGHLCIVVGPEGGFSSAEYASASAAGMRAVRLGPRVLRAETAAIAAVSVALAAWGDL